VLETAWKMGASRGKWNTMDEWGHLWARNKVKERADKPRKNGRTTCGGRTSAT